MANGKKAQAVDAVDVFRALADEAELAELEGDEDTLERLEEAAAAAVAAARAPWASLGIAVDNGPGESARQRVIRAVGWCERALELRQRRGIDASSSWLAERLVLEDPTFWRGPRPPGGSVREAFGSGASLEGAVRRALENTDSAAGVLGKLMEQAPGAYGYSGSNPPKWVRDLLKSPRTK